MILSLNLNTRKTNRLTWRFGCTPPATQILSNINLIILSNLVQIQVVSSARVVLVLYKCNFLGELNTHLFSASIKFKG